MDRFSTHAVKVRRKEIVDSEGLIKSMAAAVPNDEQFRSAFASESVNKEFLARYYLLCLEKVFTEQPHPHLAEDDESVGSLEHVLPRNPNPKVWDWVDEEAIERLCSRIGNLALLAPTDNSNRGNDSFEKAREYYAKSPFLLTQEIAKELGWDDNTVNDRQDFIANLAVDAWPIS